MWRIHLLGKTGAFYAERACKEITAQEALLLACLALAPKRSLTRSELAEWLWSDEDCLEDMAHRLRQILFKLKTKLRQQLDSDSLLIAEKNTVALHPDVTIDTVEFAAAIVASKKAATSESEEEQLCKAIQLYGGQLLPQHLHLFCEERERWSQQYQYAQKRLAELSSPAYFRLLSAALLSNTMAKRELSVAPVTVPHYTAKTNRLRYQRATLGLLALGLIVSIAWAGRRPRTVPAAPTAPIEITITSANVSSVREELNRLRTGGTTTETAAARNERQKQHAELCVQLMETADRRFWGPEESIWQNCLESTGDSQKTAFDWCLEHDSEKALQISGIRAFHLMRKSINDNNRQVTAISAEGRQWLEAALQRSKKSRSLVKARALRRYITVTYEDAALMQTGIAVKYAQESLEICRQGSPEKDKAEAYRLVAFATAAWKQPPEACKYQQEALKQYQQVLEVYRSLHDTTGEAQTYLNMAHLGGLKRTQPAYWMQLAEWARKSLQLFRKVESQYGVQRALKIYESTIDTIDPRFAAEKKQWKRWLLEDYCIEAQRAEEALRAERVAAYRMKILGLAAELQDGEKATVQLLWFFRNWNRFRPSSEVWARIGGLALHLDDTHQCTLLSKAERQELLSFEQSYRSQPNLHSKFQEGSAMSLKDAAAFVANPH